MGHRQRQDAGGDQALLQPPLIDCEERVDEEGADDRCDDADAADGEGNVIISTEAARWRRDRRRTMVATAVTA